MPQLDLIIDTYVRAGLGTVAPQVADGGLPAALWPRWRLSVEADRGLEGMRWQLDDQHFSGSTEVWLQPQPHDTCRLHTFVRVDRRRPWPQWQVDWRRHRLRMSMTRVLWQFKDSVEADAAGSPSASPGGATAPN